MNQSCDAGLSFSERGILHATNHWSKLDVTLKGESGYDPARDGDPNPAVAMFRRAAQGITASSRLVAPAVLGEVQRGL